MKLLELRWSSGVCWSLATSRGKTWTINCGWFWSISVSQNSSSRSPLPPPLPQPHGWQLCRCSWGSLHTTFRSQDRHNRPYPTNVRDFWGHCIERILSKITSRFLTRTLENRGRGQVHSKCLKKKKLKKPKAHEKSSSTSLALKGMQIKTTVSPPHTH